MDFSGLKTGVKDWFTKASSFVDSYLEGCSQNEYIALGVFALGLITFLIGLVLLF